MPNFNRTGPKGQGAKSGQGLGQCGGSDQGARSGGKPRGKTQQKRDRSRACRRDGSGRGGDENRGQKQTHNYSQSELLPEGEDIPQPGGGTESKNRRGRRW